jgi:hypothetical protein
VEAVAHPPELGGGVAGPPHIGRDEEIETAAGDVGNFGEAPRALVEFRSGGAAVDLFRLALAPSFLRAICSIPLFGNSEIRRERLLHDTNKNTNKTNGCSEVHRLLPLTFRCLFNALRQFSQKNQESNQ